MSKVIVVTGASRGIGYHLCKSLARRKQKIVATARSENALYQLQQQNPDYINIVPADLVEEEETNKIVSYISDNYQKVNILVNNAGALINKPFTDLTSADWRKLMEVNILAAVNLTRKLLPQMVQNGHIVNISSMGGFQGSSKFPGLSAYSVSKGALSILSECLAVELKNKGVKSNALCLGAVQTEMLEEAFPGIQAPVKPAEMGEYIADFALEGSKFYNGQILPVTIDDPG